MDVNKDWNFTSVVAGTDNIQISALCGEINGKNSIKTIINNSAIEFIWSLVPNCVSCSEKKPNQKLNVQSTSKSASQFSFSLNSVYLSFGSTFFFFVVCFFSASFSWNIVGARVCLCVLVRLPLAHSVVNYYKHKLVARSLLMPVRV